MIRSCKFNASHRIGVVFGAWRVVLGGLEPERGSGSGTAMGGDAEGGGKGLGVRMIDLSTAIISWLRLPETRSTSPGNKNTLPFRIRSHHVTSHPLRHALLN